MGNGQVNVRKLVIKEGMTPQDVKNNPKATPQQKAFANIFDADGVKGYSAREAEVFNSTTITDNGKKGVTLWTQFDDGTKKGSTITGDVTAFKYAPQGEVRPFIKKVKVESKQNKQSATSESITTPNAPKFSEDLYKDFKDWTLETRDNSKHVVGHDSQGCLVKDDYFSSDILLARSRTKNGKELEYREYNADGSKDIIRYIQDDGTKVEEKYFSSNHKLFFSKKTKDGKEVEYREYNTDGSLSDKRP